MTKGSSQVNSAMSNDKWQDFKINGKDILLYQVFHLLKAANGNEKAIDQTSEFCLVTNSEVNQRTGLEFLYAYGYLEKMERLIEKNLQSSNKVNQQWGLIYQVIHQWKINSTKPSDYLTKIDEMDIKEQELICLKEFIYVYAHFEREQYGKLGSHLDRLIDGVHEITDPLIQELFSIRLDELLMTYHWKRNEMIISRKHGYKILNRTYNECKKADVHKTLALGFIYDSYEQSMYHAKEALRLAKKHDCKLFIEEIVNQTIPFIAAYYRQTAGVKSNVLSEQAYLALADGDRTTCIRLLSNIENLNPFEQYYLGKATENIQILEQARCRFINERSDYFFAKLPFQELNKMKAFR